MNTYRPTQRIRYSRKPHPSTRYSGTILRVEPGALIVMPDHAPAKRHTVPTDTSDVEIETLPDYEANPARVSSHSIDAAFRMLKARRIAEQLRPSSPTDAEKIDQLKTTIQAACEHVDKLIELSALDIDRTLMITSEGRNGINGTPEPF